MIKNTPQGEKPRRMMERYLNGIYYRKNNFSKRQTLVFVHGLSGSSSAWRPYERKFQKRFNVLSMDLRGHGKSFRPGSLDEYAIGKFCEDIYEVIKKEKIPRFILISHSFGNLIALDFARRHQKMLKALILVSADSAPSKRKISKALVPLLVLSKMMDMFNSSEKRGSHIDYGEYLGTGDWNIRRSIADISNTGLMSYLSSLNHAYGFDIESSLPEIRIPTLVIHGDKDTIFPIESGRRISRAIKDSRFVTFEGADHIIVLNNFDRLSKEIDRFVNRLK